MQWIKSPKSWIWSLLIVSLAFNIGFAGTCAVRRCAGFCRGLHCDGGAPNLSSLHGQLNLTSSQSQKMMVAKEELLRQLDEVNRAVTIEQSTLGDLLAATEIDRKAIGLQLDTITSLQRQAQQAVVDHLLQEREFLTPDQKTVFINMIRSRVCSDCVRSGPPHSEGSKRSGVDQ